MLPSRSGWPALLVIAALILAASAAFGAEEEGDLLLPGPARERPIRGGETHFYRLQGTGSPLLVIAEQHALDLVVRATGPGVDFSVDLGEHRWGSEVLLLESPGDYRIEVRPKDNLAGPGRYTIGVEAAPSAEEDAERHAALSRMSLAGQEAFARTPEAFRRAVSLYREAEAVWHSLGERRWEAEALSATAIVEKDLREWPAALNDLQRVLPLWRELGDPRREAATLNEIGLTRASTGETQAARKPLEDALPLWQSLGERLDEAVTRNNLCYLDLRSGALPAALSCYQETRALFHDLGEGKHEALTLNNLGGVYDGLGEPEAALEHYEQAIALRRQLGDLRSVAESLNNLGTVYRVLGEWQEALRFYAEAGEVLAPVGDRSLEAARLTNVGFLYNNLGEPQRALPFLEEARKLRQETGDRGGEILPLNHLGESWRKLGDLSQALRHHQQALDLAKALGDRRQEAITRLRLAEVRLDQRDPPAALQELDPAIASFQEMGLRQREAQALQLRGRALALAGRASEARPIFEDVLARRRGLRDRVGEAEALQALATVERSLGLPKEARAHADEAVARVEELRTGFVSPNLRAAFVATQRRSYSLVLDLLMDQHAADPKAGHDQAAFEVSERARARSLLDVLQSGSAVQAGSAVPAGLFERRQSLRRRLTAKADQQVKQGATQAETLGREIETLRAELDGLEAEIHRSEPRHAAAPPTYGVESTAGLLDADTLLLEYSLGEERSYLWVIGAGFFRSFTLPPEREIEALANQLYGDLSTREAGGGRRREVAESLSRILLAPAWPGMANKRRLAVVPDAALERIPFSALPAPDSGGPLLGLFEIAYVPSATTLALQRQRLEQRPPAAKWAAVLADPVFAANDPRLKSRPASAPQIAKPDLLRGGAAGSLLPVFERLPFSRKEAEAIAGFAPSGQVWTALGLEASRGAVLSGHLRGYRAVHFATHGLADPQTPELSGLVLSQVDAAGQPQEGFLSLADLYDLDLDADLVVLSGCRTALGKEVRGEGILGLTRGFFYAGVPRVVASLWRVDDSATEKLMTHFYRALWQDHLPAAAALRAAQQSLRRDPQFRDPRSWA
ncbi:MAG TPA: CHAT domain-containing tetratricopeptide repeat protein, partial [Thermoanaerobaculia bacterium]|nr:CHAT domain-containing tetratricopeptide repeat protein [Thermoanaerobaculia bacterium]